MKKLVLLGGSVAALRAVEILRDRDRLPEQVVMLLSELNTIADRDRYPEGIIRQLKPRQLCYRSEDIIISGGMDIISDKTASRVNVTRKKIHFDDRSQMDYDILVIADTSAHKFDDIKGNTKEGVFGLTEPGHVSQIGTLAALNDAIAMQSDRWSELDLAIRLGQKQKEVILSVTSRHPLLRGTDEAFRASLIKILHGLNISLHVDNGIEEILGDSDVKAVKMRSGKVYAAQLVILDDVRPDLRIFSEGLEFDGPSIVVDNRYATNIPDVFAVDYVAQRSRRLWQNYGPQTALLEFQGQVIADVLSEYEELPKAPVPRVAFGREELGIIAAGQLTEGRSVSSRLHSDPGQGRLIRIFEQDERTVGAMSLNGGIPQEEVFQSVEDQRPAGEVWEQWTALFDAATSLRAEGSARSAGPEEEVLTAPAHVDQESASKEE